MFMWIGRFNKIVCLIIFYASSFTGQAQPTLCPWNIDFEQGNFDGWDCKIGSVSYDGSINTLTWSGSPASSATHRIISALGGGIDYYGRFPESCPNGSGFSVKLGNNSGGAQAEAMTYRFTIPATVSVFSIFFHYAIVLQNPNHAAEEQPRFRARIFNVTDQTTIDCVNFDFTASGSLPGFQISPTDASVVYKDWTPITLNLTSYAGKTIELEFITSDCTRNGHFGYAYVDVNSNCNGAISGSYICPGYSSLTMTAPYGFAAYQWYSDNTFSTVISNIQDLTLTPPPSVGTVYPVVVTPFPGFGCQDTVYATIGIAQNPVAIAGPDKTVCSSGQVQLGGPSESHLRYSWSPASLLTNPLTANPITLPGLTGPTTFSLSVLDIFTGCPDPTQDEVIVTPTIVDTSLTSTGNNIFCKGDIKNSSLMLSASSGIQWYQNTTAIPSATTNQYDPNPHVTSTYWAIIKNLGCTDSTRKIIITVPPNPVPRFTLDNTVQCLNIPVDLINTSTISSAETLSYLWRLSDGSTYTTKDLSRIFTNLGNYEISLKVTSASGCSDSTGAYINVIEHCNAYVPSGFTPNNDGKNDIFKPILWGVKKLHRFSVFDRRGYLVYSTKKPGDGWDGNNKGVPAPSSVYVWLLEYDTHERKNLLLKGTVVLLR